MGFKLYGSLETRAKRNGRAIDTQWINENESNEYTLSSSDNSTSLTEDALDINKLLDSIELDQDLFNEKEDERLVEEASEVDQIMDSTDVPETQFEEERINQDKIDELRETRAQISSMRNHLNSIFADDDYNLSSGRRL
jgi:hypothetical protein